MGWQDTNEKTKTDRHRYSQVSDLRRLLVLRKYCGFSITGILVMPMMTASAFISEDEGVLEPLDTWWRGLAESSSLLMTEEGPVSKTKICTQNQNISFLARVLQLKCHFYWHQDYIFFFATIHFCKGSLIFCATLNNRLIECSNKIKQKKKDT